MRPLRIRGRKLVDDNEGGRYKKLTLTLYVFGEEEKREEVILDGNSVIADMPFDPDRTWVWKAELTS